MGTLTTTARTSRTVHPWWVAVVAGLASFVDGAALSANGIALVMFQTTIGLTASQVGILTAVVTFSVAIGSLVGGRLGDRFGRRTVFIVTMLMIVLGSLAPAFGASFWVLFAGLTVLGLGVGADLPVSLATMAEAATDKNRGAMLVFSHVLWIAGSLLIALLSMTLGDRDFAGQLLFGVIAAVGLVGLLLRLTIPESERWLQSREEQRLGIRTVRADRTRVRDLVQPPFRRPFLVLVGFYTLVSVAGNLGASFSAYVAVNVAQIPVTQFSSWMLLISPLALVALFALMRLIDTRFRMPMLLIGGLVFVSGFLIPVVFDFSALTLVLFLAVATLGSVLCGEPIARVWSNESFPTMLRSTGQGFVFTFGKVVVAILSAAAPAVIALSPHLFFTALAAAGLLGLLIGWTGFRGGRIANEFDHEQELEPAAV